MINYKDHEIFDKHDYVVGVDPGSVTGVSIFDRFGLQETSYHVALPAKDGMEKRTLGMAYSVINISMQGPPLWAPGLMVIENNYVHFGRSKPALEQREIIAVIAAYAHKYGFTVLRVAPKEVKASLAGSGDAKKPAMVAAARLEFPGVIEELSSNAKREAVADSIGIALAGIKKWEKEACDD